MADGLFNEAEELCINVLDADEKNADAFEKLGEIYNTQDRVVEANIFFEKALKIKPYNLTIKDKLNLGYSKDFDLPENISKNFSPSFRFRYLENTINVLYSNKTKASLEQTNSIAELGTNWNKRRSSVFRK